MMDLGNEEERIYLINMDTVVSHRKHNDRNYFYMHNQ